MYSVKQIHKKFILVLIFYLELLFLNEEYTKKNIHKKSTKKKKKEKKSLAIANANRQ
jgi:hypothetical protein